MILKFIGKYWNKIDNYIIIAFMYFVIIAPMQKDLTKVLAEMASIPKYSINNDFEKMRTKKDGNITIDLNNKLEDNHVEVRDSIQEKEKFFRRIFKKK